MLNNIYHAWNYFRICISKKDSKTSYVIISFFYYYFFLKKKKNIFKSFIIAYLIFLNTVEISYIFIYCKKKKKKFKSINLRKFSIF